MKKTSIIAAIVFVAVGLVFVFCNAHIKSQKDYKVVHFAAVSSEPGPDGKAAVGAPESFKVEISPALAWEKGDGPVKAFRNIALVLLILTAVYIALSESGVITGSIHYAFVGLVLSLGCYLGAYSSAFSNNYKELTKEQYEAVKDNPEAMKALFDKPLIK